MVDQKEEAKMESVIETMPTMIQTHLIICKDWADVKDRAKSLKHIIRKYDPPTPTMPLVTTDATILGLYSHIAHSVDKAEEEIPPPFKGAKLKQTRGRGKPKGKPQGQRQNPPKAQEAAETTTMIITLLQVKIKATDLETMARVLSKLEDVVMVGAITRVTMALTNISIIHMISRQNSMAHPVVYAVVSIIPLSTATKENMT